jgi:hypothetical protein
MQNSATYLLISAEYLRDKAVAEAISKTEDLLETEVRAAGGDPKKMAAARKQGIDLAGKMLRERAAMHPLVFQQECRQLSQDFLLRKGPFSPLRTIFPQEIAEIEIWTILKPYGR